MAREPAVKLRWPWIVVRKPTMDLLRAELETAHRDLREIRRIASEYVERQQ